MAEFNASEVFDDEGNFTETGRASLVGHAGEGHADTKVFDDVKGLGGLCKAFADTKSALGRKLENVIEIPADDAADDIRAAYRAKIATASGHPADAADYKFFKSETLPEGMTRSQDFEDKFRAIFHAGGASTALVETLTKEFEEMQIAAFNGFQEQDKIDAAAEADETQRVFDEGCAKLKTDWPGDKLAVNARISLAAIEMFGDDELKGKLKEAGMYENASDLAAWNKAGVPLNTLRLFNRVGLKTLDAKILAGNVGGGGGGGSEEDKAKAMYPNTKF